MQFPIVSTLLRRFQKLHEGGTNAFFLLSTVKCSFKIKPTLKLSAALH